LQDSSFLAHIEVVLYLFVQDLKNKAWEAMKLSWD